jgi:hypothetical protein
MNGFVQTRCPRCGNAAWGHPAQATPCHTCGLMMPPSGGAIPPQPHAQAQAQPQPHGMPAQWGAPPPVAPQQAQAQAQQPPAQIKVNLPYGVKLPIAVGGGMKVKLIAGIVLAAALAIGGVILKKKLAGPPKGMIGYSALKLDKSKPAADALYASLAGNAKKWKSDATFWSLNYQAVRADGTVDVSKGAEVVYVSPSASASTSKKTRSDSIRKYGANASGVKPQQYGWNDPLKDLEAHPAPGCTIKNVVDLLATQGLTGDKTVRITFDPKFADYYAWRVIGTDPKLDVLYSWDDCSIIK